MKALTILFMLFAADAVAQHPGGCADVPPPTYSGRINIGRTAFKPRVVERAQYKPRVTYSLHLDYSPRVRYRAGDVMSVPRVARPPRAYYYQRRPQAYFYSDLNNYQGNFSYGVFTW
jgi:hypothetical protein